MKIDWRAYFTGCLIGLVIVLFMFMSAGIIPETVKVW